MPQLLETEVVGNNNIHISILP